jgi:5-methylthioadenosine/S-adenosylhomocysteine deaminase
MLRHILERAPAIATWIDTFLAEPEVNLLDKILAIGNLHQGELFEIQKARIAETMAKRIGDLVNHPMIRITKASECTQYDTYFLWDDVYKERIRLREDYRVDTGAWLEPKYTIRLTAPARGECPRRSCSAAHHTAPADRTPGFYRGYFRCDYVVDINKKRRRWRLLYNGEYFAINLDALADHSHLLLRLFRVDEGALVKQEYVELSTGKR